MQQRRGIPKGGRRYVPFGCRRHRDKSIKVYLTPFTSEMRFGELGTATCPSRRHPRGGLVGDPVLSDMDSRQVTSGMTVKNTTVSTSTKSA
mgnify:CR=1 FL=1